MQCVYVIHLSDKITVTLKTNIMTLSTNNFESKDFMKLMNIYNVWGKYFAGLVVYKGAEVQAKSAKLKGLFEFGQIVNYIRKGKDVSLEIEFCGDNGIWNEVVKVQDCKTFNIF